jgi:DNA-binding NarL/FixJ family response regulator
MDRKRVVIVDDHDMIRLGVRVLLENHRHGRFGFDVVMEAVDGQQGWQAVQRYQPDLVVLDIDLPGLDGYEVLRRIKRLPAPPKVVMFSRHQGVLPVRRAQSALADGFIYKTDPPEQLIQGVDSALRGRAWGVRLGPEQLMTPHAGGPCVLSLRERCVAENLMLGHTNKAIARDLCLSPKTVSAHKRNIFRKLAITNLIELADCLRDTDSFGLPRETTSALHDEGFDGEVLA